MKKFVLEYYGGFNPQDLGKEKMKEVMDVWSAWFAKYKNAMIDSGNPFGPNGMSVTAKGAHAIPADMWPAKGYSIVNAVDMNAAVKIAQDCPIHREDNSPLIRVYEAMSM